MASPRVLIRNEEERTIITVRVVRPPTVSEELDETYARRDRYRRSLFSELHHELFDEDSDR